MKQRTAKLLGFAIVTLVVLMLPVLISSNSFEPICKLSKANAQDNPCLEQAATNSALQLELQQVSFQATLDTINFQSTLTAAVSGAGIDYQATITALEDQLTLAQTAGSLPTSVPPPGLPFEENFSTNQRGWDLTPNSQGSIRMSQGTLAIEVKSNSFYWQPIPGLEVGDEFYIEATINPKGWWSNRLAGFAVGDETSNQYHIFALGCDGHCTQYVGFYDNQTPIFLTRYDFNQISDNGVRVGLEARSGIYTLYIDGQPSESAQISSYGNQLGLAVVGDCCTPAPVFFDDLVVRESR